MHARLAFSTAAMAAVLLALAGAASAVGAAEGPSGKRTIGLALTVWAPAVYETAEKSECPAGFHSTNKENWLVQLTEEQRAEFTRRYIHLGPASAGGTVPELYLQNRGPNGENIDYNPTLVKDPLPLKEVQSKVAYGDNLDGTLDGHATANSCRHDKFVSPDGEQGIDNQLYRVIGCLAAWRKGGFNIGFNKPQFLEISLNRILIEISDVDDELNDDHVDVAVYKGVDRIVLDGAGKPIPWEMQRIDVRFPRYTSKTTGRIRNGVLITDPVDMRFPMFRITSEGERYIRDTRLRLKLTETGAEGLLNGYEDLNTWWKAYSNNYVDTVDSIGNWSPPAFHEAAYRLADGHPDAKTGQCTAISASYLVEAVRAFVVQPKPDDPLVTDPNMKAALKQLGASRSSALASQR
jgi:hypothetical protein